MSVPMINCAKCGEPMPANYEYCPNCGHTNAFVSPESAVKPPVPRPNAENEVGTEMASAEMVSQMSGPETPGETPMGGTPTLNIGSMGEASGEAARYTPPPAAEAASAAGSSAAGWQPGQYTQPPGPGQPTQSGPAVTPPPAYSPGPMQPGQYPPPPTPGYGQQPPYPYPYAATPPKDSTVALLLELLGYVFFLGIGHIYGGRTTRGILLLIGYWAYWTIVGIVALTVVGIPLACIMAVIHPVVPILSALWIKREMDRDNAMLRR